MFTLIINILARPNVPLLLFPEEEASSLPPVQSPSSDEDGPFTNSDFDSEPIPMHQVAPQVTFQQAYAISK